MKDIDYSVIIRTIGKANEKYQMLLDSISKLEPLPIEVIVVLPEGFDEPQQKLGWETFYYSKKGMVAQRTYGISKCKTKYAFICDDDVNFGSDFIKKLYEPLEKGLGSLSVAPLYSFLPPKGLNTLVNIFMSSAAPTLFHKGNYCTVLRGTGYSYNRHLKTDNGYYYSQSAAGTCFFANINDLRNVDFESEHWIDMNGYSAMEDETMFYKAFLMGYKTVVVPDAYYVHADAKTSTRNNALTPRYCLGFNRTVFWYRFIYSNQKNIFTKIYSRFCFLYHKFWKLSYEWITYKFRHGDRECYKSMKRGYKEAKKYILSDSYSSLPKY